MVPAEVAAFHNPLGHLPLPVCVPAVAGVDLNVPVVGSSRPTFLYMQASCGNDEHKNCGKLMRFRFAQAFNNSDPDVEVRRGCLIGGVVLASRWCNS
jgi:hypothetical protein